IIREVFVKLLLDSFGKLSIRAVVRLPDPKLKFLGERGIECIFVGYAEHSKAFRIPDETEDIGGLVIPEKVTEEEQGMRSLTNTLIALMLRMTLKKAINDEIDSIMGNNTWVLANLPLNCKPLVARISTIRLLIAMASFHNLVIHQMDMKTALLNGDLDEEVYMNQPQGFIMPGNENKDYKLIKSSYGLKQALKKWHQKFDEVVLSNGYLLNQADKCVYSKFDKSGKGVIIYLYVDDMLIFGTDQVQVDLKKEFLSSRFYMKDMGRLMLSLALGLNMKVMG
ncbi:zinc finger, CCHC-type containing protein, partial [Tanacetum coccineum]